MSYEHLTIMLSLPRSRSAWMAEFLRPLCAATLHNPLQQCDSVEELGRKIDALPEGRVFVSDVAAMFFFSRLLTRFPGARYLVVHRAACEVERSMRNIGISPPINIRKAEKQLLEIANHIRPSPWSMTGTFFELHSPQILAAIAAFSSGRAVEPAYLRRMMQTNIQVSIQDQVARTDIAKQRMLFSQARILQ